jgi:hypothetical protein
LTHDNAKRSKLGDTLFAIVHLLALVGLVIYALVALIQGNALRFAVLMGGLALYYILVLHKPVRREIDRKRKLKSGGLSRRP